MFILQDLQAGRVMDQVDDLASRITLLSINPQEEKFIFGTQGTQKDWIIMEAVRMPLINILWIGTILLVIGLSIAITRRYREFRLMRDKSME
jgi:cytochrome c-type biogenesis protein CcmF